MSTDPRSAALNKQIGGNHYKDFAIQPIEIIIKNKLSWIQGNVIKRIMRYNKPTGKGREDLLKIQHEIDLLLELDEDLNRGSSICR